jgi:hypothetical protein
LKWTHGIATFSLHTEIAAEVLSMVHMKNHKGGAKKVGRGRKLTAETQVCTADLAF